jgi:uncharacterized protein (DUF2236 family)
MPRWYYHYIYLALGIGALAGAVVSTLTGTTRASVRGWIYRAKDPKNFWWVVAIYYVGGVLLIGKFLLQ